MFFRFSLSHLPHRRHRREGYLARRSPGAPAPRSQRHATSHRRGLWHLASRPCLGTRRLGRRGGRGLRARFRNRKGEVRGWRRHGACRTRAVAQGSRSARPLAARGRAMNLSDWRRRIDEIDKKLVELLNERSQCALEIGRLKQAAKIPLYQPDRENEVLENAERNNPGPLTDAAIRRLFERIIDEARAAERDAMHSGDGAEKGKK